MIAVKSPVVAFGLASVNVATVAVNAFPSVALTGTPVALSVSPMILIFIAAALAEVLLLSLSVTLKLNELGLKLLEVGTKTSLPAVISAADTKKPPPARSAAMI